MLANRDPGMCYRIVIVSYIADGVVVEPYMAALLPPEAIDKVKLLEYIPYARRRITKVLPPAPDAGDPTYLSQLCRIVTAPSPWTEAEGWRRSPLTGKEHEDSAMHDAAEAGPLELEGATMEDPALLEIWIERSALGDDCTGQSLIGMALRGRWGLFGIASKEASDRWWAFRSKNCESLYMARRHELIPDILPALWSAQQGMDEITAK